MNLKENLFRTRYLPLYPRLYGVAMRLLANSEDAADAVQETMVKIWNMGDELACISAPEALSFKILRFTAIDMIRRRSRTVSVEVASLSELAEELSHSDSITFLSNIIDMLPPNQREVVRLSAFDDLPPDEIAELTGHSPANVRQLLSRGRKKIRDMYLKYTKS